MQVCKNIPIHFHHSLRMGAIYTICIIMIASTLVAISGVKSTRPNIIFIIADDMGWDDVSFHGSDQILTPNIDLLAYSGVALERYYSHCICTPSRSALLTGKYSHTIGMHGYPLSNSELRGLPLNEKILPQYLKELGYATHLVGKWHVGDARTEQLPTSRGFDSHFGNRGGYIDYYEYLNMEEDYSSTGTVSGLDMYRNETADWVTKGYITDVYNNEAKKIIMSHDKSVPLFLYMAHIAPHAGNDYAPLQAPPEDVRAMRHIESPGRRIYAAMVKKLDDSVGDIVQALSEKGILNNTIIVFVSDNGGITTGVTANHASNWPLRGVKLSPFEGGVRVNGLIWSSKLSGMNHLWKGYMHVVDWLPTLLSAVDGELPLGIDGIDLWDNIIKNTESKREEIFDIDDNGYVSIISGDYKLIAGPVRTNYSNFQGGDLRGIIGNPPLYMDAIKKSKIYSILKNIGKPFHVDDMKLRNKIRIKCKEYNGVFGNICYPQNGTWCLFNIKKDPCERQDVSKYYPEMVKDMLQKVQVELQRVTPRIPIYRDPRANPSLHNYTWTTWADILQSVY